ncbi:hypothetical protein [Pseudomonas gingeri]|uniref:hypothetical protein n=1 Tax=Pseudomonas gingeri TaxID=117681 RepID=UPI0015A18834|nr:hypothetical protein [Pseudomonas gingeri]NWB32103.1 hypothetical protein [Pseudomonas gingeri]NWD06841.1 hypothetical protein [Pseudomonas gingeri]NWE31439.1 hypothetical protein [Pseudomonas gingeri]NWE57543.1 hypothetical protein [Pseudomonas gingeri]NWE99905.1 hypothetical protein [Pseudomonas gingeri]
MYNARICRFFNCALIATMTLAVVPVSFALTLQDVQRIQNAKASERHMEFQNAQQRESAERAQQFAEQNRQFQERTRQEQKSFEEWQRRQAQEREEDLRRLRETMAEKRVPKEPACKARDEERSEQLHGEGEQAIPDLTCDEHRAEASH